MAFKRPLHWDPDQSCEDALDFLGLPVAFPARPCLEPIMILCSHRMLQGLGIFVVSRLSHAESASNPEWPKGLTHPILPRDSCNVYTCMQQAYHYYHVDHFCGLTCTMRVRVDRESRDIGQRTDRSGGISFTDLWMTVSHLEKRYR